MTMAKEVDVAFTRELPKIEVSDAVKDLDEVLRLIDVGR